MGGVGGVWDGKGRKKKGKRGGKGRDGGKGREEKGRGRDAGVDARYASG